MMVFLPTISTFLSTGKQRCGCVCTYAYVYAKKNKALEIILKFPKAGKF